MIFITVGTEQFGFDRLLKLIDMQIKSGALKSDVFAQIGNSGYEPQRFGFRRFLDFDVMTRYIQQADIVIAHAGEGTMLLCLSLGKIPIIFPRRARFGEHVDDHQVTAARIMQEKGSILAAFSEDELLHKLWHYAEHTGGQTFILRRDRRKTLTDYLKNICDNMRQCI